MRRSGPPRRARGAPAAAESARSRRGAPRGARAGPRRLAADADARLPTPTAGPRTSAAASPRRADAERKPPRRRRAAASPPSRATSPRRPPPDAAEGAPRDGDRRLRRGGRAGPRPRRRRALEGDADARAQEAAGLRRKVSALEGELAAHAPLKAPRGRGETTTSSGASSPPRPAAPPPQRPRRGGRRADAPRRASRPRRTTKRRQRGTARHFDAASTLENDQTQEAADLRRR